MDCELIDSREKLVDCVRRHAARLRPPARKLAVQLPELSAAENRYLAFQINRLLGACGCFQAGLASGSTVLLLGGYLLFGTRPLTFPGIPAWSLLILAPAGAALLAKAATIAWARVRLLWLARSVSMHEPALETRQTSSTGGN